MDEPTVCVTCGLVVGNVDTHLSWHLNSPLRESWRENNVCPVHGSAKASYRYFENQWQCGCSYGDYRHRQS